MAELSKPAQLLNERPRIFWGKVIEALISRGWSPPPPDEKIVDELLRDMATWDFLPVATFDEEAAMDGLARLSPGEVRVVQLVVSGHSNPEVAELLGLSLQTVKFHLTNVYAKLGIKTRTQLVAAVVNGSTRAE